MQRNTFVSKKVWRRNPKIISYYRRIYLDPTVRKLNSLVDGQSCVLRFTFINGKSIQDRLRITSGGEIEIWKNPVLMKEIENADKANSSVTIELL